MYGTNPRCSTVTRRMVSRVGPELIGNSGGEGEGQGRGASVEVKG